MTAAIILAKLTQCRERSACFVIHIAIQALPSSSGSSSFNWCLAICQYTPRLASSSSCAPCSTILPLAHDQNAVAVRDGAETVADEDDRAQQIEGIEGLHDEQLVLRVQRAG